MNLRKNIQYLKICLFALLCIGFIPSCISDGEETYVLEEPQLTASQMIIGGWRPQSVTILDEDGNQVPPSELGSEFENALNEELTNAPEVEFSEDGKYTITYPGSNGQSGNTTGGSWNISDDDSYLHMGNTDWEIQSFGKNKLVIIRTYYYNGVYYYIVYIYIRTSTPETLPEGEGGQGGNIPGLGDTSDNNPYKPYGSDETLNNRITQIKLTRRYTDDNTINKTNYLFKYDAKARISEYKIESINTNTGKVAETKTFHFTYDNQKVYLYYNGELMNTGLIGSNGCLTTLYEGNSTEVNSTFSYNQYGYLTYAYVNGDSWSPSYNYYNQYPNGSSGDEITWGWGYVDNIASIDFNGLVSTIYQIEWSMHYDYSGIVWGLFDFYGSRNIDIAAEVKRGSHWTDKKTKVTGYTKGDYCLPTLIEITRTGLNSPFVATYEIIYEDPENIQNEFNQYN